MGQWCSGRPVYQTSDRAEESEEDLLCGSSEEAEEAEEDLLCGGSEEANIEREVERQEEENIDKEAGRGERLLVRGGYWEVQVRGILAFSKVHLLFRWRFSHIWKSNVL